MLSRKSKLRNRSKGSTSAHLWPVGFNPSTVPGQRVLQARSPRADQNLSKTALLQTVQSCHNGPNDNLKSSVLLKSFRRITKLKPWASCKIYFKKSSFLAPAKSGKETCDSGPRAAKFFVFVAINEADRCRELKREGKRSRIRGARVNLFSTKDGSRP